MTTRRTFIQLAGCAALPVSAGALEIAARGRPEGTSGVPLHAVVIESDWPAGRAFGNRLARDDVRLLSIPQGDITSAWLHDIRRAWRQEPVAIAGLTAPAALFCFEQLAFSQGLRVVFHAEHVVRADGMVSHEVLRGGPFAKLLVKDLAGSGQRWPVRLADALIGRAKPRGTKPGPSLAALQPVIPEGATLLTSWIIAPV